MRFIMKLLFVDCCISIHEPSRTKRLADAFLDSWKNDNPDGEIEVLDIKNMELKPLDAKTLLAREEAIQKGDFDNEMFTLAKQFARADRIVIAAPYWDMSFPAKFRTFIELVSARGISFDYKDDGKSYGKCMAEKLIYLLTAGGTFAGKNQGSEYIRTMCDFFGINEFYFLGAPMQDIEGVDSEGILRDVISQANALAKVF